MSRISSSSPLAMLLYCSTTTGKEGLGESGGIREQGSKGDHGCKQKASGVSERGHGRGGAVQAGRGRRATTRTSSSVMSRMIAMARSPPARRSTGAACPGPACIRPTTLLRCHAGARERRQRRAEQQMRAHSRRRAPRAQTSAAGDAGGTSAVRGALRQSRARAASARWRRPRNERAQAVHVL